jgi:hypothetical protein
MDRFIHHYTRYRAHSDSLALEQKMHTTNIHRIRHSLHASAIGTNPWLQVLSPSSLPADKPHLVSRVPLLSIPTSQMTFILSNHRLLLPL